MRPDRRSAAHAAVLSALAGLLAVDVVDARLAALVVTVLVVVDSGVTPRRMPADLTLPIGVLTALGTGFTSRPVASWFLAGMLLAGMVLAGTGVRRLGRSTLTVQILATTLFAMLVTDLDDLEPVAIGAALVAAVHPLLHPPGRSRTDPAVTAVAADAVALAIGLLGLVGLGIGGAGRTTVTTLAVMALLATIRFVGALPTVRDLYGSDVHRVTMERTGTPQVEIDADGTILDSNAALRELMGGPVGLRRLTDFLTGEHWTSLSAALARSAISGTTASVSFTVDLLDGSPRLVDARVLALRGGREPSWILTIDDQTRHAQLELQRRRELARLKQDALTDELTGLLNRRGLVAELGRRLARRQVTVMFIDLDGFKQVNDQYGHEAGDAVLVEVGHRLRWLCRSDDAVGRLGGDEFVLVAGVQPLRSSRLADLAEAIGRPIPVRGVAHRVGASIGVASAPSGATAEALLTQADLAMYEEKRRRRGVAAPAALHPPSA